MKNALAVVQVCRTIIPCKGTKTLGEKGPLSLPIALTRGNAKAYGKLALRKVSLSNELSDECRKLEMEGIFHVSIVLWLLLEPIVMLLEMLDRSCVSILYAGSDSIRTCIAGIKRPY